MVLFVHSVRLFLIVYRMSGSSRHIRALGQKKEQKTAGLHFASSRSAVGDLSLLVEVAPMNYVQVVFLLTHSDEVLRVFLPLVSS